MRIAPAIIWTAEQRERLQVCARSHSLPRRLVERARLVLLAADGLQNREIALILGMGRLAVARWRQRFLASGQAGIERDAPRPGRKPKSAAAQVQEIMRKTTQEIPSHAKHWSTRSMARASGITAATVRCVWRAHGLKPHRVQSFKLSNDPQFAEKLEEIVGLYLNPPEHTLVLSLVEKSQLQALDRTQPCLPLWVRAFDPSPVLSLPACFLAHHIPFDKHSKKPCLLDISRNRPYPNIDRIICKTRISLRKRLDKHILPYYLHLCFCSP